MTLLAASLALLITAGAFGPARASDDAGTRAHEFLRLPAEPEGRSLAGAHLATVAGPSALAWNPAGLARSPSAALLLSHATWMAETGWEWGAVALPVGPAGGAGAVAVGALRVGALDQYDSDGNALGQFAPLLTTVSAGYALSLSADLRLGLCAEGILERSGLGEERTSWAGGLGLQWEVGRLAFGLSGLHLAPATEVGEDRFPLPMTVRGGGALRIGQAMRLHSAVEWVAESAPRIVAGWEWQPVRGLRALTGLMHDPAASDQSVRPAYGLSCAIGGVGVAYGYQPAYWLEPSHQLSITLGSVDSM